MTTRTLVLAWLALLALLALTVGSALIPLGTLNLAINFVIAAATAWIVAVVFREHAGGAPRRGRERRLARDPRRARRRRSAGARRLTATKPVRTRHGVAACTAWPGFAAVRVFVAAAAAHRPR